VRRALLVVAVAILAAPLGAGAQPATRLVRVGFLSASSAATDYVRPALVDGAVVSYGSFRSLAACVT
jgi:hypothetical protein